MVKINLLPLSIRKSKVALAYYAYGIMGGVGLLGILVLVLLLLLLQIKRLDVKLSENRAAYAALSGRVAPFMDMERQTEALQRLREMYGLLQGQRRLWIQILDELADRVPEDAWLTKLQSARRPGGAVALKLEGEAYYQVSVAEFMKALEESPRLRGVGLTSLTEQKAGESGPQIRFEVKLDFADGAQGWVEEAGATAPASGRVAGKPKQSVRGGRP